MNIFDDADDMAWYTSALLSDIVDSHAPVKSKFVKKKQSVPYMNSKLRKTLRSRNMARNKFRTFGKRILGRESASAKSCGVAEEKIHCEIFWKQLL